MVITDANDFVGDIHDRMPVILEQDQFEPWLSGAGASKFSRLRQMKCCNAGRFHGGSIARGLTTAMRR
jgi:putative SOS response-associated peptidase YedK